MHMVQFRVFKALVVIFVKVKDVFRLCFAELLKILDQFYYKMSLSTLGAASNGKKERPDNFNHDQEKNVSQQQQHVLLCFFPLSEKGWCRRSAHDHSLDLFVDGIVELSTPGNKAIRTVQLRLQY